MYEKFLYILYKHIYQGIWSTHPTNTPRGFHVEATWKRSFSRRFNVESTWCVCRELAVCIVRRHWFEKFFGSLTEEFLRPYQKPNNLNTPLRHLFRILLLIDMVSSHESVFRGVHFVWLFRSAENDWNINLLYFWKNFLSCANRVIQK